MASQNRTLSRSNLTVDPAQQVGDQIELLEGVDLLQARGLLYLDAFHFLLFLHALLMIKLLLKLYHNNHSFLSFDFYFIEHFWWRREKIPANIHRQRI